MGGVHVSLFRSFRAPARVVFIVMYFSGFPKNPAKRFVSNVARSRVIFRFLHLIEQGSWHLVPRCFLERQGGDLSVQALLLLTEDFPNPGPQAGNNVEHWQAHQPEALQHSPPKIAKKGGNRTTSHCLNGMQGLGEGRKPANNKAVVKGRKRAHFEGSGTRRSGKGRRFGSTAPNLRVFTDIPPVVCQTSELLLVALRLEVGEQQTPCTQ